MSNTEQDPKKQTDQATSADPKKKQGKVADRGGELYLSFPQEVMSGEDDNSERFPHSILFTLLIREKGKSSGKLRNGLNPGNSGVEVTNSGSTLSAEKGGTNAVLKTAGGAIALGGAAVVGKKAIDAVTGGSIVGTIGTAIAGGAGYLAATNDEIGGNVSTAVGKVEEFMEKAGEFLFPTDTVLKTGKVMRLYVPQAPQEVFGASWSETELGTLLGAANSGALGQTFSETITNFKNAITNRDPGMLGNDAGAEFVGRKLAGISAVTQALGFNFDLNAAIELNTGKVPNPYKEQLFKSMSFRKFAYQFVFAPKNPYEMAQAYKIMDVFRRHMHPEKDDSGLFFHYPSLFQIEYQYKGKANQFLTKIADCALTNMSVDYGANSTLTTVKGTSGAPTEIKMTLQFQELKLLDRAFFENWGPDAVKWGQEAEGLTPVRTDDDKSTEQLKKEDDAALKNAQIG